jgi:hypothetical protein
MSPLPTAPARLTADLDERAGRYLRETLRLLYPDPQDPSAMVTEYSVIPSVARPRLLVPAGSPRVAAAAVRRYAEPQSRLARLKRDAVVAAFRTGASHLLLRDRIGVRAGPDSIEAYLRRALGRDLLLSLHIGPSRANRKPVLQVLSRDGDTLGFAKLAAGPLTDRLVRAETAALHRLGEARLTHTTVAAVRHAGDFRGHPILVQSALPVWRRRDPPDAHRLARAMAEVAEVLGVYSGALRTSQYWSGLRERLDAVANTADGRTLAHAAFRLVAGAGATLLRYGCWHGDWAPWNMAELDGAVLVWDWERFASGVPYGFDALHHALARRLRLTAFGAKAGAGAAVQECIARAPATLAGLGTVDRRTAELTALLYLVDLAARYLEDRQAEAGSRLGVLGTWLLPVLVRQVDAVQAAGPAWPDPAGAPG